MIGLMAGLVLAIIALVVLLAILADQLIRANAKDEAQHAACTAHVSDVASRRIVAMAVRDLAERYDTPTGMRETAVLRTQRDTDRTLYRDASLPAAWMLTQAERIEGVSEYGDPPRRVGDGA